LLFLGTTKVHTSSKRQPHFSRRADDPNYFEWIIPGGDTRAPIRIGCSEYDAKHLSEAITIAKRTKNYSRLRNDSGLSDII
jgi:hypothetical protein